MKIFIVHAHPEPLSFNGALTEKAKESLLANGHEVIVSDLYQMGFNPVSDRRNFTTVKDSDYYKQQIEEMFATTENGFAGDIQAELDKLDWCDVLIFQFPLWWFGLPAILKGWVDKVFAMGKIYGAGKWYDQGYFSGKRAMCALTIGGLADMYTESGINGSLEQILFPINHGMFYFCGFTVLPPYLVHAPIRMTDLERVNALEAYGQRVLQLDQIEPIRYKTIAEVQDSLVAAGKKSS